MQQDSEHPSQTSCGPVCIASASSPYVNTTSTWIALANTLSQEYLFLTQACISQLHILLIRLYMTRLMATHCPPFNFQLLDVQSVQTHTCTHTHTYVYYTHTHTHIHLFLAIGLQVTLTPSGNSFILVCGCSLYKRKQNESNIM